jgi:hypothetical protein
MSYSIQFILSFMSSSQSRRSFVKKSCAAALITSVEEFHLLAEGQAQSGETAAAPAAAVETKATLPAGTIGKVKISRLICGGNLITGYAHSRDLIYVSNLLKAYFTEAKIMDTWALCEEHGINTMIFHPSDRVALDVYRRYRARGGKIQFLAQLDPPKDDLSTLIHESVCAGAIGALLVGNYGDAWTRDGDLDRIGKFVELVKAQGLIAGVAGHELRTPMAVEKAGIKPDFYMKTFHSTNYWSARQPDQLKEVIDNYGIDNYWCRDPEGTARFFAELDRPWMAYKVLAAGAIHPKAGFKHAFQNGADFCVVGMFDFQVAENVVIANEVLAETRNRQRDWAA